jgi:hypothetical protein
MPNKRHERDCTICHHAHREDIEADFVAWVSPTKIAQTYRVHRNSLYLHTRAMGLTAVREKNLKAALAGIIERGLHGRVSAGVAVQAVIALSKLNERGETVDRVSISNPNFFNGWTRGELDQFARTGTLPARYKDASAESVQWAK